MSMPRGRWGAATLWPISAVIVGLGGGFALGRTLRQAPQASPASTEIVLVQPEAAPPEQAQPGKPAPKAAAPEAAAPKEAAAETPKPSWIGHFRSEPAGATVTDLETGDPLGVTPFDVKLPSRDAPLKVVVLKPGYASVERTIEPISVRAGEVTIDLALEAEPPPKAVAPAPKVAAARPHHVAPKPKRVVSKPKRKPAGADKAISNSTTIDPFN